jgi:hypothetical protein
MHMHVHIKFTETKVYTSVLRTTRTYEEAEGLRTLSDNLRPPVLSHFASTLQGITSLRAYKSTLMATNQLRAHVDAFTVRPKFTCL